MSSNPPASTLRDGNLKASIWQNEGDKGTYYSTTFARTYKDENGKYYETQSFSANDLLRVAELARQSFHQTHELRQQDYEARSAQVEQRLQSNRSSRAQSRDKGRDR